MKYIKQIRDGWRSIVLSLLVSVSYFILGICGQHFLGMSVFAECLTGLLFLFVAGMLFFAALSDVLKAKIDQYESRYIFDKTGCLKRIVDE